MMDRPKDDPKTFRQWRKKLWIKFWFNQAKLLGYSRNKIKAFCKICKSIKTRILLMINSKFVFKLCLIFVAPFHYKKHGPGHKGGKKEVRRQQNVDWWPNMNFSISACHLFWNCSWILRNVVNILLVCSNFR